MMDRQNFFDQLVKNDLKTNDKIKKTPIGQEDDCMTGRLLDYNYFNNYNKIIAIDLSKLQELDADPNVIQQVNLPGNLNGGENVNDNTIMFFIIEKAKEVILDFSQGTVKVLWICSTILFCFNII